LVTERPYEWFGHKGAIRDHRCQGHGRRYTARGAEGQNCGMVCNSVKGAFSLVVSGLSKTSVYDVRQMFARAIDHIGTLHVVVSNAGLQRDAPFSTR